MKDTSNKWIQKIYNALEEEAGLPFEELRKCVSIEGKSISEQELSKGLNLLMGKGLVKQYKNNYIAEDLGKLLIKSSYATNLSCQGGVHLGSLYVLGVGELSETSKIKKLSQEIDKSLVNLKCSIEGRQKTIFSKYFNSCIEKIKPYDLKIFLRENEDVIFNAIVNVVSERSDDVNRDFKVFFSTLLLNESMGNYYSKESKTEIRRLVKVLRGMWGASPVGPIEIVWKNNNYDKFNGKDFKMIYDGVSEDGYLN